MTRFSILRVVTKMLLPYILLFGLYTQFHGDYGPGGGFQAGVIFGAGLVLYGLVFGLRALRGVVRPRFLEALIALGVLLYAGVGIAALLAGGHYLEYAAFDPHHPQHGQHWGLFLIELGVGMTVSAVTVTIFFNFAGRRTDR